MIPDLNTLGRRAVACRGWRWLPGMVVRRWSDYDVSWSRNRVSKPAKRDVFWLSEGWIPDLNDPATLGCLLALVREAWGDPYLCCVGDQETGWRLDGYAAVADLHSLHSEAEALVAALEAAP